MKNSNLKIQLHQKCAEIIEQRITELKSIIQESQDAANNETKSSAGDKHETGRAMAQLETEKLSSQLSEALKTQKTLQKINPNIIHQNAALGSLAVTNNGIFYLSVGLGQVEMKYFTCFAISPASPVGKVLMGLKEKDKFSFNGRNYIIERIL